MSDKKKINLDKPMSWAGQTYGPGIAEIPAAAADYAERRKFGKIEGSSSGDADFEPLPIDETFARFEKGDDSDEVYKSLKYYQPIIAEAGKSGKAPQQIIEERKAAEKAKHEQSGNGKSEGNPEDKSKGQTEPTGLPKDFPARATFEKLGFKTVGEVQAKTRDELIALNGIAETSADNALAYGKGN